MDCVLKTESQHLLDPRISKTLALDKSSVGEPEPPLDTTLLSPKNMYVYDLKCKFFYSYKKIIDKMTPRF